MTTNNQTKPYILELSDLESTEFGLTPHTGGAMAEAASICLESQGHGIQVGLHQVDYFEKEAVEIRPLKINEAMIRSHGADEEKATYDGAEGVAILLMKRLGVAKKFERARKSGRGGKAGGFDYWFVEVETKDFLFEVPNAGRLEVSGIRCGNDSAIRQRLKMKTKQTKQSDAELGDRPTYAIVVEFGQPQTWVRKR